VSEAVDDAVRDADGVAALEADVVLRGDAHKECGFLAPETGYPAAIITVGREPSLLGSDPARRVLRNSLISARTVSRGRGSWVVMPPM
jgi:hypothetical protein